MITFIANSPFLICVIALAIGFAVFLAWEKYRDYRAERIALEDIAAQADEYGGLWPGNTEVLVGDNWQLICPDCGTYNVMHRVAGIACRHCRNELLITPKSRSQGGTEEPMGVISRVTGASNNRVDWTALSPNAPMNHPARRPWSPAVFQDVPSLHALELNPPTDLDWDAVHHYMPIVCPTCKGNVTADCEDCRRTGLRFVPLASWRKDGVNRASQSGVRYQRLAYSGRCGVTSERGIEMFNGLYFSGRGGWGALVMEGRRKERNPMPDELDDIERAKRSDLAVKGRPLGPDPRIKRPGDTIGGGGYQPLPDESGRVPLPPNRRQP